MISPKFSQLFKNLVHKIFSWMITYCILCILVNNNTSQLTLIDSDWLVLNCLKFWLVGVDSPSQKVRPSFWWRTGCPRLCSELTFMVHWTADTTKVCLSSLWGFISLNKVITFSITKWRITEWLKIKIDHTNQLAVLTSWILHVSGYDDCNCDYWSWDSWLLWLRVWLTYDVLWYRGLGLIQELKQKRAQVCKTRYLGKKNKQAHIKSSHYNHKNRQ